MRRRILSTDRAARDCCFAALDALGDKLGGSWASRVLSMLSFLAKTS